MRCGRLTIGLVAAVASAAAIGCGGSDDEGDSGADAPRTPTTSPASADRQPQDAKQRAIRTGSGDGGVTLAKLGDFDQPLYVTQPAADPRHVYVVEQCGRIMRAPVDGGEPTVFLDLGDLVTCGGEQGLLSIAFAPGYGQSGLFYVDYTGTDGESKLVEYRRSAGDPAAADPRSARELLSIEDFAANHNGGLALFGPDDSLYIGTGDGGGAGDPERTAQDLSSLLGKILRIDPAKTVERPYAIPEDNPALDGAAARPEVAMYGLRNPWRFSFDRETGDLWIGDVGQDTLEEIDSVPAGELGGDLNFGWSAFEGSNRFNGDQEAPGAIEPTFEYGRGGGCSVTGGYVVRDPALPTLYGRYLYGDYCLGQLHSFTADARAKADDDRGLGLVVPSLSSFGEDAAGHLYATSLEGPVYRLVAER